MHTKRHARNVIIGNLWTRKPRLPHPAWVLLNPVSIVEITPVTLLRARRVGRPLPPLFNSISLSLFLYRPSSSSPSWSSSSSSSPFYILVLNLSRFSLLLAFSAHAAADTLPRTVRGATALTRRCSFSFPLESFPPYLMRFLFPLALFLSL